MHQVGTFYPGIQRVLSQASLPASSIVIISADDDDNDDDGDDDDDDDDDMTRL